MVKVYTALVTPFTQDASIDYEALGNIIDDQLTQGCQGFIVCGTTAETPALSEQEKFDILHFVIEKTGHCVPLWFGCGTNCTQETIRLVRLAQEEDIDGVLLVTPYYNRPSQKGLYAHFKAVHDAVKMPIMLYNVPSRTGVALAYETIRQLIKDCPRIQALKQASGDLETIAKLHCEFPGFAMFSGEDGSFVEGISKGMCGLISVMSHYNMKAIQEYLKHPDPLKQRELYAFAHMAFLQSSPSTIKYMISTKGLCLDTVRLPLVPLDEPLKKEVDAFLKQNATDSESKTC